MRNTFLVFLLIFSLNISAQEEQCKLKIGTNLSGLSDYMTEMPFVDMMHHARNWGTRNIDWSGDWNTELTSQLETDENGYPLKVPFNPGTTKDQMVFTVWAIIDAWEPGIYTFLYDGEGEFDFRADGKIIKNESGRAEVEIIPSNSSFLELVITQSKEGNHLRNFRLIQPGHEASYQEQPFNPLYLEKLQDFEALRFMDWGRTNNWGEGSAYKCYDEAEDTLLVPWSERAQMNRYTWANNKGVPYEMMVQLGNALHKNIWVCVPHNASDEYITNMAELIKDKLDPELKVYAEYSNEIWNWMFGQTQWLNTFFCEGRGMSWPEGIVDHVQNNLNIWNQVFADQPERLITVAGGQTSWQDVTNRIVKNLEPGSFDALNITGYFHLGNDDHLDQLGPSATVKDVANQVREKMHKEAITWIQSQHKLARELDVPLVFYEAGQHVTPSPFGEEPSYGKALIDFQRDTSMYNIYHEWFNLIENVLSDSEPSLYMNFSFVGGRSARYGSWGILETLNQDTSLIAAPKYKATLEQIHNCGKKVESNKVNRVGSDNSIQILPKDQLNYLVYSTTPIQCIKVMDISGKTKIHDKVDGKYEQMISLDSLPTGVYIVLVQNEITEITRKIEIRE